MAFAIRPDANPLAKVLFDKWEHVIESHKSKENVEIEVRFGRRSGSKFDTNVGETTFKKVLGALKKYDGWDTTHHMNATVYYFEGAKRLTVDEETDEQVGQVKTRVKVDDTELQGHPLDVRLGISTETPWEYDGEETSTEQKTKERWSFVRKNLSIDLSIVKGTPDDKDSDEDTTYQIEMEIVRPSEIQNKIELYNLLHKVFDVLKCI
jgi:mRNA capping enzyme, beta chain